MSSARLSFPATSSMTMFTTHSPLQTLKSTLSSSRCKVMPYVILHVAC